MTELVNTSSLKYYMVIFGGYNLHLYLHDFMLFGLWSTKLDANGMRLNEMYSFGTLSSACEWISQTMANNLPRGVAGGLIDKLAREYGKYMFATLKK